MGRMDRPAHDVNGAGTDRDGWTDGLLSPELFADNRSMTEGCSRRAEIRSPWYRLKHMGKKTFKKPKVLIRKMSPSAPLVPPGGIVAGFPEFWQTAHDAFPRFFAATDHLVPLVNVVLAKPIGGQLPRILHYMTAIISNSLGSLITLALNGYGHDAVRIALGMFENSVNAAYLAKHPTEVQDYLEYHWIKQRRLLDYMRKDDPALFQQLKQSDIDEIDTEYSKVVPRFTGTNGKIRKDWCTKNLRQRAEDVGMGTLYPTFYGYASSIHHGDIGGLAAQISTAKFQAQIAPSLLSIRDALIMGHQSVIVVIGNFNDVAALGLAEQIKVALEGFQKAWDS
jgi:hypothetical protein